MNAIQTIKANYLYTFECEVQLCDEGGDYDGAFLPAMVGYQHDCDGCLEYDAAIQIGQVSVSITNLPNGKLNDYFERLIGSDWERVQAEQAQEHADDDAYDRRAEQRHMERIEGGEA